MTAYALLFTLAAIGIAETAYLIRERYAERKPVCPIGGGCHEVLSSKYNRLFGIHNDVLGLLFYVSMSFLTGLVVVGVEPMWLWIVVAAMQVAGAAVMSCYFVYLQWRVLKAWCFWCLMSAATVAGMGIIMLLAKFALLPLL
jgi:uncharacterized membrane protein